MPALNRVQTDALFRTSFISGTSCTTTLGPVATTDDQFGAIQIYTKSCESFSTNSTELSLMKLKAVK